MHEGVVECELLTEPAASHVRVRSRVELMGRFGWLGVTSRERQDFCAKTSDTLGNVLLRITNYESQVPYAPQADYIL